MKDRFSATSTVRMMLTSLALIVLIAHSQEIAQPSSSSLRHFAVRLPDSLSQIFFSSAQEELTSPTVSEGEKLSLQNWAQRLPSLYHSNTVRIGIPYDESTLRLLGNEKLDWFLHYLASELNAYVILELETESLSQQHDLIVHNHEHFVNSWRTIAETYKFNNRVIFSLLYRPVFQSTEIWIEFVNSAIKEIRDTGSVNLILVAANHGSDLTHWNVTDEFGLSNSEAFLMVQDSFDRIAFDVHQSLASEQDLPVHKQYVLDFTQWLEEHNKLGFLTQSFFADFDLLLDDFLFDWMSHSVSKSWIGWSWEDQARSLPTTNDDGELMKVSKQFQSLDVDANDLFADPFRKVSQEEEKTVCHYACEYSYLELSTASSNELSILGVGCLSFVFMFFALIVHP